MTEIFDDIRKLYVFRSPGSGLEEYIEFFSESSPEATARYIKTDHFSVKLFPSFTPTIWINLGAPYQMDNGHSIRNVNKTSDILVLRSTLWERKNVPADHIFTIKFRPLGFEAIFGISQAKIGHDIVDAGEILSQHVIRKIKEPLSLEEKSEYLENVFREKLRQNSRDNFHLHCIKKAIDLFMISGMESKLNNLAAQLNVSEKTFYRYFYQIIGTNPKDFFSITRCRTSLTAYKNNRKAFSPYDFGYYDFGHFSKEVKRFTGSNLTFFES
jgi:AraC-like DNA-binding protein